MGESGAELTLDAEGAELTLGLPAANVADIARMPRYELRTRLSASGSTVRELAGSLNGRTRVVFGEGQLRRAGVGFLARDFVAEVISVVNPFERQSAYASVQCIAVLATFEGGVLKGEPAFVYQSDKLNIAGDARVDLGSEKLNVKIRTQARKGLGLSVTDLVTPFSEIGGTLANPILQLDTKDTLVRGGAAAATGGLSILARRLQQRLLAESDPCRAAIKAADEAAAPPG